MVKIGQISTPALSKAQSQIRASSTRIKIIPQERTRILRDQGQEIRPPEVQNREILKKVEMKVWPVVEEELKIFTLKKGRIILQNLKGTRNDLRKVCFVRP